MNVRATARAFVAGVFEALRAGARHCQTRPVQDIATPVRAMFVTALERWEICTRHQSSPGTAASRSQMRGLSDTRSPAPMCRLDGAIRVLPSHGRLLRLRGRAGLAAPPQLIRESPMRR
jgi:hypothetical protein